MHKKNNIEGQLNLFDLFSFDEAKTKEEKKESKPKKQKIIKTNGNFFQKTIFFAKSIVEKFQNNLAAIKEAKEEYPDQEVLAKYEGWGGMSSLFDNSERMKELQSLVGNKEFESIKDSMLTSYYTPQTIISFIYDVLEKMGVDGKLNILDPAMGTGNFYRLLPENLQESNLYGVELDSNCGNIAKKLFPKAKIQINGFEKSEFQDNFFDLVIGNVPFGDFSISDTTYGHCYIHDYFFARALDLTRPGGIVAMITSKGTMDKKTSRFRRLLSKNANLLYGFRLPENVFEGTNVTTDILFFQKVEYKNIEEQSFVTSDGTLNNYYFENRRFIFGEMKEESWKYGTRNVCKPLFPLEDYMKDALEEITPCFHMVEAAKDNDKIITAVDSIQNMSYGFYNDKLYYRKNSFMEEVKIEGMKRERIIALIELRDTLNRLISRELTVSMNESLEEERKALNETYDTFIKKYNLIHSRGNKLAFENDASYYLLCSLENLDEDGNLLSKADIFSKRTIQPYVEIKNVDNANDALTASIVEKGCIDFDYMKEIYPSDNILDELHGFIYKNPETNQYETEDCYLSGNIRHKLEIAKEAGDEFSENVAALTEVLPEPIPSNEIDVRLGATWVDAKFLNQFVMDVFGTPKDYIDRKWVQVYYDKKNDNWTVKANDYGNQKARVTYGTNRLNGYDILEKTLNMKDCKVYDTVEDMDGKKRQVVNQKETTLAMGKQEMIQEKFHSWIFADYERRMELTKTYNDRFNSIRYREFNGDSLKFPYMNQSIKLDKHQKDAVMRINHSKNNSLIGHAVGYGKTFTAIAAVMEAKRLGISNKNLIVVPNALVGQWGEEFLRLYPGANVLVSNDKDFSPAKRMEFCSKIATGEYDAIIISHSQFQRIPISKEYETKFYQKQLEELENMLESAEEGFNTRNIQSSKKQLLVKLEKLADTKRDNMISFEQLGITKLIVDEAHYYKNLFINTKMSNIGGLNTSSNSKRAMDMYMKCRWLEEQERKGIVFLTGTPVANSMAEIFTMQRYLQLDTLESMGLHHFDSWASTFGEVTTSMELAPEGKGYRSKNRFSRFVGLPELLSIFKEVADIKVEKIETMELPTPIYKTVSIEASEEQKKYVDSLAKRAESIRNGGVDTSIDNMLKVTNEGRKLALDQRLVGYIKENSESKAVHCVENAVSVYEKYPGKTQVIFCDLATPSKQHFNVYDDVKQKLIQKGIPESEIAFIHEAKTNKQKVDLCKKVDEGKVRILLGSTDKAGTGCNYQTKLIAMHDLDCPWRPSDLTQRAGRIIRQGNFNKEVFIYRYVTKSTFDSYMWQTVENKQRYISQILSEKDIPRRMKEDETTLSYAEIKAAACGNPEIKKQMELTLEVKKLKTQKQEFFNQQYNMEEYIKEHGPKNISNLKTNIESITKDIEIRKSNSSESFEINGQVIHEMKEIDERIKRIHLDYGSERKIGSYSGFKAILTRSYWGTKLTLQGNYAYTIDYDESSHIMVKAKNELERMEEKLETFKQRLEREERKFVTAKEELSQMTDFPQEDKLIEKEQILAALNLKLAA